MLLGWQLHAGQQQGGAANGGADDVQDADFEEVK